jgi:hypothetical protein
MGANPDINPSPTPLGESLSLKSGYEEWVQIQILIPPLPPWVKGERSITPPSHMSEGSSVLREILVLRSRVIVKNAFQQSERERN